MERISGGFTVLKALNADAINIGPVGELPPVFAQAAGADLVYAAAIAPNPKGSGAIVREGSPIKTVADLKGKKLPLPKAPALTI